MTGDLPLICKETKKLIKLFFVISATDDESFRRELIRNSVWFMFEYQSNKKWFSNKIGAKICGRMFYVFFDYKAIVEYCFIFDFIL